jgi:hypothetical protein
MTSAYHSPSVIVTDYVFRSRSALDQLLFVIRYARNNSPDSRLGVGTGWSGQKTLFDDPLAKHLHQALLAKIPSEGGPWEISAWGNIMKSGDQVSLHHHRQSHLGGENVWAGVFYVHVPVDSGPLMVYKKHLEWEVIQPASNTLVMFLANTLHEVPRCTFSGERVSVAFNVRKRS